MQDGSLTGISHQNTQCPTTTPHGREIYREIFHLDSPLKTLEFRSSITRHTRAVLPIHPEAPNHGQHNSPVKSCPCTHFLTNRCNLYFHHHSYQYRNTDEAKEFAFSLCPCVVLEYLDALLRSPALSQIRRPGITEEKERP